MQELALRLLKYFQNEHALTSTILGNTRKINLGRRDAEGMSPFFLKKAKALTLVTHPSLHLNSCTKNADSNLLNDVAVTARREP